MNVEDDLFLPLHSILKKMRKILDAELIQFGFSHAEMRILMALYLYYEDGCNQDDLTAKLEVDRSNVGRALKKLEQLNYVKRSKEVNDRRVNSVLLTEQGKSIREQLFAIRGTVRKTLMVGMNHDELGSLKNLLEKADQSMNEKNYRNLRDKI